jgi:hypothetical protein
MRPRPVVAIAVLVLGVPALIFALLQLLQKHPELDNNLTVTAAMVAGLGTAIGAYFAARAAENSAQTAARADEALALAIEPTFRVDVVAADAAEPHEPRPAQLLRISTTGDAAARDLRVRWRFTQPEGATDETTIDRIPGQSHQDIHLGRTEQRGNGWALLKDVTVQYADDQRLQVRARRWWDIGIGPDALTGKVAFHNIVSQYVDV